MRFIHAETNFSSGHPRPATAPHLRPRNPRLPQISARVDHAKKGSRPLNHHAPPQIESPDAARLAIAACRSLRDVLGELHALLEQYGPSWYTERHSQRTENALRLINGL